MKLGWIEKVKIGFMFFFLMILCVFIVYVIFVVFCEGYFCVFEMKRKVILVIINFNYFYF